MSDDVKLMTEEEAKAKLEKDRETNEMVSLFYKLTEGMPDSIKKFYEDQIVKTVIMGDAMGQALFRSEKGSREYNSIVSTLTKASQKTRQKVDEEMKDITGNFDPRKDVND